MEVQTMQCFEGRLRMQLVLSWLLKGSPTDAHWHIAVN